MAIDNYLNKIKVSFEKIFKSNVFDFDIIINRMEEIPLICKLNFDSKQHQIAQNSHIHHVNPVHTFKGEIFNALITMNVGCELSGNHLVIIMQNRKGNIYGNKISVLPIEGDGTIIDDNFLEPLCNNDLEWGNLDKNPSRIIMTDIMTIDKARLDRKIGKINFEKMQKIDDKLKKQLDLK